MTIFALSFIAILLGVFLFKAKLFVKDSNTEYFSKQSTDTVKAACAICVVLHHIVNEVECGTLFSVFRPIGFLMVAIFFFCSGYGLFISMKTKRNYIDTFLSNRFSKLLVPYIIALVLYSVSHYVMYGNFPFVNIASQFIGNVPVVRNSWFIIVLIYLYTVFWICFKFFKNNIAKPIFYISILAISVTSIFPHWSPAIITFLLGALVAEYKAFFDKIFVGHSWMAIVTSGVLFSILFLARAMTDGMIKNIFSVLCCLLFVIAVLSLLTKIKFGNKIISFISLISFEIYLYHGLVMSLLNRSDFITSNPMIYITLTIVFTILIAYLMWLISGYMIKIFNSKK